MDSAGLLNYYDASYTTASSASAWYNRAVNEPETPDMDRQPNLQWTLPKTPTSYADGSAKAAHQHSRHGSITETECGAGDKDQSDDGDNQGGASANKRKRPSRYKGVSEDILIKRRAQNRSSQRAYRDRKNMRIKELEAQLADVHRENDMLNMQLRAERQVGGSGVRISGDAVATTAAAAGGSALDWSALNLSLDVPDLPELAFSPDRMLDPWPVSMNLPSYF